MPAQPEIKTERLLLRKMNESDWEMVSYLRTDKIVNQFIKRPTADTKEKALEHITRINKNIENGLSYNWCISKINNPKMMGTICLWNFSEDKKTAELGYDLNPEYHQKGVMTEALKSIVSFGFNQLNLDKIEAFTQQNNIPSRSLLEKNYFTWNKERKDKDNDLNIVYELDKQSYLLNF